MTTYLLQAESLLSRYGFSDGDMFSQEDPFDELLFLGDGLWISDHLPLMAAVRKYLLPLLDPGVVLEEIDTHHNPIRATTETKDLVNPMISVEVTFEQVWSAFTEAYPDDAAKCGKAGKPTEEDHIS